MDRRFRVVYENGVFRPLGPVDLAEHQQGTVTIPDRAVDQPDGWLDTAYVASCAEDDQDVPSLEEVRQTLAEIPGSLVGDFRAERDSH